MAGRIIIAIDGYSSCGKSTLARDLAKKLSYRYIDTGAMYRAVTYHLIRHEIELSDIKRIADALDKLQFDFEYDNTGKQIIFLDEKNIEEEIRQQNVTDMVSKVSSIAEVRKSLVDQQKKFGLKKGIVMDGRDIGTVVFPEAELKLFMTADPDVRAMRRHEELKKMNLDIPLDKVKQNLLERDHLDSTRKESPLIQAPEAVVIDNTHLSKEEQLDMVLALVNKVLERS